jgi:hypothetical protein
MSPRRIGTPPTPLYRKRVCPPPSPAGEVVGDSQFGRLEKKPSTLSTMCTKLYYPHPPPWQHNYVNQKTENMGKIYKPGGGGGGGGMDLA